MTYKSGTVTVKGDLKNYDIKRYPNEFAILTYTGASSTCLFVDDWYDITDGTVWYSVRAIDYGLFSASGYTH